MFDTPYNRKIAQEVLNINKKYIKHAEQEGQLVSDSKMKSNVMRRKELLKGDGIFSSLLSKIGLGEGPVAGAIAEGRRKKHLKKMGGNWVDDMTSGISQGMNALLGPIGAVASSVAPLLPLLGVGKKQRRIRYKPKIMGLGDSIGNPVEGSGIFSSLLSDIGLGKPTRTRKARKGKGEPVLNQVQEGGRRRVRRGGALLTVEGRAMEGGRRKGKGEEMMAGKKRKPSKWIEHVKSYSKKHNMKYNESLKDPNCRASYKK
jgi:hypothetical protein